MSKFLDLFKKYSAHNRIEKTMRNKAQIKNSSQHQQPLKNKKHH